MNCNDSTIRKLDQVLISLYRHLSTSLSDKITGGITLSQLFILRQVALGVETANDIALKLKISPPAVSKLVEQLVNLKLITRTRSEADRRVIQLQLTSNGREVLKSNTQIRHEILKEIIASSTEEEIETFINMLDRIVIRLQGK